jgi:flagellar hook-basal body complex protein FliE
MSISPLSGIASSGLTQGITPLSLGSTSTAGNGGDTFDKLVANALDPINSGQSSSGDGFGKLVTNALDTVNTQQANADRLAELSATGQLQDPHEYMIAATEASLSTELTVAVRNKAVEAFNDIMRMSL